MSAQKNQEEDVDSLKSSCMSELKNEFSLENFKLSFENNSQFMKKNPEEVLEYFHSVMWPCKKFKLVYMIYRLGVAIYYTIWFIESILANVEYRANNFFISNKKNSNILLLHPWYFYMTSWSLTILLLHLWTSAFIVVYFYSIDKKSCLSRFFSFLFGPFSCSKRHPLKIDPINTETSTNTFGNTLKFWKTGKNREIAQISSSAKGQDATDMEIKKFIELNEAANNFEKVELIMENKQVILPTENTDKTQENDLSSIKIDRENESTISKLNKTLCDNQSCKFVKSTTTEDAAQFKLWFYSHVPCFILNLIKISWLLYNLIIISALLVTIGYFAHVRLLGLEVENTLLGEVGNFHRHGINSIVALIDLVLMAYPVRLLHFIYTAFYGWLYAFVIFIYWYQNPKKNIVYEQIDYGKPFHMIGMYILLTFVTFIMQTFHFAAYKLKLLIKEKVCDCYLK